MAINNVVDFFLALVIGENFNTKELCILYFGQSQPLGLYKSASIDPSLLYLDVIM